MTKGKPMKRTTQPETVDPPALLDRLLEELAMARQMLEEIQEDLAWAIMNYRDGEHVPSPPLRITSMPLDPCAADWPERVNRYSADDVVPDVCPTTPKRQGELF